jgi:hypothetical protein
MQKKDDIVIGKPSVALRHFLAHEDFNSRIKSVDLGIIFHNCGLLSEGEPATEKYHQQCNY